MCQLQSLRPIMLAYATIGEHIQKLPDLVAIGGEKDAADHVRLSGYRARRLQISIFSDISTE